jgi:hypothetical protein
MSRLDGYASPPGSDRLFDITFFLLLTSTFVTSLLRVTLSVLAAFKFMYVCGLFHASPD